jgi:hypothetical protein
MKTLSAQAEIGPDGKLRIEAVCDLPPGRAEAVVILSDVRPPASPPYDTLEGALAGLASADFDVDKGLRDMNDAWKSKLEKNQ